MLLPAGDSVRMEGDMAKKCGSIAAAAALCLVLAPAHAADLKADINAFIHQIETGSHGLVKWQGAKRFDVRQEGDAAIADIGDARITIQDPAAKPPARSAEILLDHVAVRREPAPDNSVRLSIDLPAKVVLTQGTEEATLTLDKGTAEVVLDAKSSRARETTAALTGARLADKKTGDWVGFGPLSFTSKVVAAADGGWTGPVDFELRKIEFFVAKASLGGTIDRIGYTARSGGPDLAALNRLRDRLEALRQMDDAALPEQRLNAMLALLPTIPSLFSQAKGELTVTGVTARAAGGEPLVSLAKASAGGALTGMSGDAAALRMTFQYDGLALAPSLAAANKVPRHAILDFGVENVATGPLRTIIEAAGKMHPDAKEADKQQATAQMLGAAAMLNPVFRVYDLAVETPDLGVEATGEANGSPLSPKGYAAHADIAVRDFDALPGLLGQTPLTPYLPLLGEIGDRSSGADATKLLKFHLASAPQKWLTLNGGDITAWFAGDGAKAAEPRLLRPNEPPPTGADVAAVQRALKAHNVAAPESGAYDGATAAAVAHFQKQNGLNVDGVVDRATRQKLGIKPPLPTPPDHK
jgi:hypothetical protein